MKKRLIGIIMVMLIGVVGLTGCGDKKTETTEQASEDAKETTGTHHVEMVIEDYGSITIELYEDIAPITVANFIKLVNEGFYDGLTFHRIMSGFMVQGGDPLGTGMGGSDETITGEFTLNGINNTLSHKRGVISMARNAQDYNSASSQFFIVHEDSDFLDGQYAAFGMVTEGMDIIDKMCEQANGTGDNGEVDEDKQPVISSIKVID